MTEKTALRIEIQPVAETDLPQFFKELEAAFSEGMEEAARPGFSERSSEGGIQNPLDAEDDARRSSKDPRAQTLWVLRYGERVGGAIVNIDEETQRNELVYFFIVKGEHSRGLGTAAWRAIEERFPETRSWECGTPYYDKRNINFYVNKCGFHIVEYFNPHHPESACGDEAGTFASPFLEEGGDFLFRKEMN